MEINPLEVVLKAFSVTIRQYMDSGARKTVDAYQRQLWSASLNFFRDDINAFEFIDVFLESIENQLGRAWREGARDVGFDPAEMTEHDLGRLDYIIQSEYGHVLVLAEAIERAKYDGLTLDQFRVQFRGRIDLWVNRYNETVNEARIWFGKKQKLVWRLGATEEHCDTCARLNGIVAYAEEWEASGIKPQHPPNPLLECGGWRCDCSLEPTTARHTANALDLLLNIAMSGWGA